MTDDSQLLRDYADTGSESAFRDLVARHLDLVYSIAFRMTDGDSALAQDVAQQVFTDLARDARHVADRFVLGGWLYRHACFTTAKAIRAERRRRAREQAAVAMNDQNAPPPQADWQQLAPVLDRAMAQLHSSDRDALVLRFFQNHDLRQVGNAIGVSADTAQKRVARALEKLRRLLRRQGVVSSAGALAALLGTYSVSAAPAGLAATISSVSLSTATICATASTSSTFTSLHLMAITKIKIAVGTALVAALGTTLVLEYQAQARLRDQNRLLRQQTAQSTPSDASRADAGALPDAPNAPAEAQTAELSRLRGQVASLQQQTSQLSRVQAENRRLHVAADEPEDPAEAEFKKENEKRLGDLKQWGLMFITRAVKNQDRLPERWEDVADQLNPSVRGSFLSFATNNYEIVYHGAPNINDLSARAGDELLFREKQARRSPKGDWVKVYCFLDGHAETHSEPDGNFETWENQRLPGAKK